MHGTGLQKKFAALKLLQKIESHRGNQKSSVCLRNLLLSQEVLDQLCGRNDKCNSWYCVAQRSLIDTDEAGSAAGV